MASVSDKITKVKDGSNPNVARVVTPRPANSDTLSVDSLTGWTEDTAVHFMTYRVDSTGKVVPGSQRDWKGMANKATGQIISLQIQNNAIDDGNLVGDIVQAGPTASWAQDLAEAMLESHNSDGSLKKGAVGAESIAKDSIVAESIKEKSITADKIDFTTMPDNKYKTTEQDTGQKWIDGRPIYRKVVRGTVNLAGNRTGLLPHGIQGLTKKWEIIRYYGSMRLGGSLSDNISKQTIPYIESTHQSGITSIDNTNIEISGSYPWGNSEVSIVLEYVK
jgi:hypothetical protein